MDRPRDQPRHRRTLWRLGTPLVVVLCGGLFVVSAQSSEGTDLRPGRYDDLADLTRSEADRTAGLQDRVAALNHEVATLTDELTDPADGDLDDAQVRRQQRRADALEGPAGLTARRGPGVVVTLSDSPGDVFDATPDDRRSPLVVHSQDIQAVVNAMWKGGASAVTVQGQRIVSTTGIKCEGSSVVLGGLPYPEPYVVRAVGNVGALTGAIAGDAYLQLYREQAADPAVQIGWDLDIADDLRAPAYDGLLGLSYATPVEPTG